MNKFYLRFLKLRVLWENLKSIIWVSEVAFWVWMSKNMVAPIFVLSLLLGCTLHEIKVHEEYDIKDIMNRYGTPSISTIVLKKDVSLYEYQGGLVEYIPQKDSLSITQYYFVKDNINIVIWGVLLENGKIKILDILEWDKNKIQF